MSIDKELINVAIEELKTKGQKVTIQAIAQITGYRAPTLYTNATCKAYVRHRARPAKSFARKAPAQAKVDQSVTAYAQYIKDSYFAHPEVVSQVRDEMLVEVASFNAALFSQAVNLLIVQGWLKASSFNADRLVRAEVKSVFAIAPAMAPVPSPVTEPMVENCASGSPTTATNTVHDEGRVSIPKPEPVYEKAFQMPLTRGVLKMTLPSVLSSDDEDDILEWFKVVTKRFKANKRPALDC